MKKEYILDILTMKEVLGKYGIKTGKRIPCPLHNGKHNNFQVYEKSFYCFKCGAGGDVIKFVSLYFKIDYAPALRKLEYDFGICSCPSLKERHRMLKVAAKRREEEEYKKQKDKQWSVCYGDLCEYLKWLKDQPNTKEILFDISYINRMLDKLEADHSICFDSKALVNALYTKHQKEGGVLFFE